MTRQILAATHRSPAPATPGNPAPAPPDPQDECLLPVQGRGRLLLSSHPADHAPLSMAQVLAAWHRQGARMVLTLVTGTELQALGLTDLEAACFARGLDWRHCPIADFAPPDSAFGQFWRTVGPRIHTLLDAGSVVAVHCRAGLGRTGTVAAQILIERGMSPDPAMRAVRHARPGSIETPAQEAYLLGLGAGSGPGSGPGLGPADQERSL